MSGKNNIFISGERRRIISRNGFLLWLWHVIDMSVFVYYTRGFIALLKRVISYFRDNFNVLHIIIFGNAGNVLYISGCPGGSRYYRCNNQSELLSYFGISASVYGQNSMNLLYIVQKFDIFVFQRVIYNKYVAQLIDLIKKSGKEIIYEADDLVFDPAYLAYMDYYRHMGDEEKRWYENGIGREILEDPYVKRCIVSTDFLAEAMKRKYPDKEVLVSYNRMNQDQVVSAKVAFSKRYKVKLDDKKIRIGYFSGSKSHNKDFDVVSDVLFRVLKEDEDVILMIVGYLDLDNRFLRFKERIERIDFVPVKKLPELILRVDINIAPLEIHNPFCQAKSALKYFEAGILGVPTVASATGDFVRCIRNGENGFIAETDEEWYEYLKALLKDKKLRKNIGEAAQMDSIRNHVSSGHAVENDFISHICKLIVDAERTSGKILRGNDAKEGKISIITPTYNTEKEIVSCILSVARQGYQNKEHIIVDGASNDKTADIVRDLMREYPHIKLVSEKDSGIYDAMNKGVTMATGEWVYFLGSDDILASDNILMDVFGKYSDEQALVLYGDVIFKNSGKRYGGRFGKLKIMRQNICHQAVFYRKLVFNQFGIFECRFESYADWVLNMRLFGSLGAERLRHIPKIIAVYDETGASSKRKDCLFSDMRYGLIRKNFGITGLLMHILRNELLERVFFVVCSPRVFIRKYFSVE